MTPKLHILDVFGVAVRLFYALPTMQDDTGAEVGMLFGFTRWLHEYVTQERPAFLVACIDPPNGRAYRTAICEGYKANRPELPEPLKLQLRKLRSLIADLGIPSVEFPGYEADDAIATLVTRHVNDLDVVVVSGDKDLMALVRSAAGSMFAVTQYDPGKQTTYDVAAVVEKLGVAPQYVTDLLALAGDSADGFAGVKGIGPKTAKTILAGGPISAATSARLALPESIAARNLSRRLATLVTDLPIKQRLGDFCYVPQDSDVLAATLRGLGFTRYAAEVAS